MGKKTAIEKLRNLADGASEQEIWEVLGTAVSELGWTPWFPSETIPFRELYHEGHRSDWLPIDVDQDGVVRVGRTRVTLYSVITAFLHGCTPEEIQQQYPSVSLQDIYSTLAYYLRHQEEVNQYLAGQRERADRERQEHQARFPQDDLRQRLLARRKPAS